MRIKARCWPLDMKLREPYTIASGYFDAARNFFVEIEDESGRKGFGAAAPEKSVTGETGESCLEFLESVCGELTVLDRQEIWSQWLRTKARSNPAACSAIDCALWDLQAKAQNRTISQLVAAELGDSVARKSMETFITIGIMDIEETMTKAEKFVASGFKRLKIKGGAEVETDIEKLKLLRKKFPQIKLGFDANQGFLLDDAIYFIEHTEELNLSFIEQPSHALDHNALAKESELSALVMADESMISLEDFSEIIEQAPIKLVNCKFMKIGGITRAIELTRQCREHGVQMMLGCMDESAVSIAAGLQLCLANPTIVFGDLDGHLDLIGDPAAAYLKLKDGVLSPTGVVTLG